MNTAVIFFFFAFVQAVFGSAVPEKSDDDITKACIAELKIDESTIKTLDALEDYDETNPNCGKLLSCTWKKLGLQDASGNVDFEKLTKYLVNYTEKRVEAGLAKHAASEATVAGWLENCRTLHGTDDGQKALKIHFCLAKGIKKFINTSHL